MLADQAVAHDLGTDEPLNVTVTSGVAGPIQLSSIVFTMVAKFGINVESMLKNLPANVAADESAAPSRPWLQLLGLRPTPILPKPS